LRQTALGLLRDLGGASAIGTEDTSDNINQGFFEMNPGPFASLALAL